MGPGFACAVAVSHHGRSCKLFAGDTTIGGLQSLKRKKPEMHVPDGFINAPVSAATGVVAAAAVAVGLRGARRELAGAGAGGVAGAERTAPLAGLVAAFIFAVQMLNFPVAAGTSGHLLGGALAAILVGPYTGVLCVSVVLLMQGVLFADGGLTALGVNITDMAIVTTVVAYALFRGLVKVLPRRRRSVTVASFVAALVSVPAAAVAFTALYALGGTADVAIGKVFTAMVGVHVLIGIGEAAITALTVGAVIAVRPDLVYGARGLAKPLELRTSPLAVPAGAAAPAEGAAPADEPSRPAAASASAAPAGAFAASVAPRRSARRVWLAGLAAALVCAGGISYYASASPDGLEKVAHDQGIDAKARDHAAKDSPLADYSVKDITNPRLAGGLAGVIGVGATLAVGTGVFVVLRRRRNADSGEQPGTGSGEQQAAGSGEHQGAGAGRPSESA
ncbi:cobalt/nickel transport system permease protein [Streptomyces sp. KS_16]|nr:cobalt/nickel transport system permease protein [Streptomyces sp. 2321.6]SDR46321.1 cobalt/nickel transport system permease protein [Streptomyces sp. KS_16]SEC76530.1 cobalt/nickel transport system permease protein [Streptomyces sp. 2133.1]SNC68988.1 cobalt/nickel transport system permease protein [Streptomyces sp. 2114.4]